jgi:glycosyltransferase involved in cell wall biosynthesis
MIRNLDVDSVSKPIVLPAPNDCSLVSVLIPAYNHEAFIEQCLDSVLHEPYLYKELVIIDDGSTDDTRDKIAAWVARHGADIAVDFTSRPNRGVAATLNELASRAKGEFLRLGASDDYFLAGGFHAQVEYLKANPGKLAVIGDSVVVNRGGETLHASGMIGLHRVKKSNYLSDDGIRRQIISRWAVGGPVAMIRKHTIDSIGGWSEDLRIDDWSFFLRLAAIDALGFVDTKVGAYRIHGNNTCRTDDVASRIANLGDVAATARRHSVLFDEPDRTLLTAEYHLIRAKIAFLGREPSGVIMNMLQFAGLRLLAEAKMFGARRRVAAQ